VATGRVVVKGNAKLLPAVAVAATRVRATEKGGRPGAFLITRSGGAKQPLRVRYQVGGTASSGADYLPLPGQVTLPAGQTRVAVEVVPVDDQAAEGRETVTLTVLPSDTYRATAPEAPPVFIVDDDTRVKLAAGKPRRDKDGRELLIVTVSRRGHTASPLQVAYQLGGSARAGVDYEPLAGKLKIPAGRQSAEIAVRALPAGRLSDKTVELKLKPDAAYTLESPSTALVQLGDRFRR
jgi:hypothetical protein